MSARRWRRQGADPGCGAVGAVAAAAGDGGWGIVAAAVGAGGWVAGGEAVGAGGWVAVAAAVEAGGSVAGGGVGVGGGLEAGGSEEVVWGLEDEAAREEGGVAAVAVAGLAAKVMGWKTRAEGTAMRSGVTGACKLFSTSSAMPAQWLAGSPARAGAGRVAGGLCQTPSGSGRR